MADIRAKKAEQIIGTPAGVTLLPDDLADSQATLGQRAQGQIDDMPLPAFKTFHTTLNVPTGEEQVSLGVGGNPFAGKKPNFKPVPPAMNVPTGEEQVTHRAK